LVNDIRINEMETLSFGFRYIVNDVPAAIDFYTKLLGFMVEMNPNEHFAILSGSGLRLMLNTPAGPGGGAQPMPDNRRPEPGGWNRIQLQVADLEKVVSELQKSNVRFRSHLITGIGAKQIIIEDPSGNPVELNELLSK
jgi:catechol 2,3-dioxygenase-like lactoylglutathione lyase family enzyme